LTAKVTGLEESPDFWRGCIDGDGFARLNRSHGSRKTSHYYAQIGLVGSRQLLEQFAAFINRLSPGCTASVRKMHSIWTYHVCGWRAMAAIRSLYGHQGVSIPRKQAIADELFRTCDERGRLKTHSSP
jgi:hypothetical protein